MAQRGQVRLKRRSLPTLGLQRAAALSLAARLPAYSFRREFVESGGLLSYGADQGELHHFLARVDEVIE